MDTLTVTSTENIPQETACESSTKPDYCYLSDDSQKDKEWDRWRTNAQLLEEMLMQGNEADILRYANRVQQCSQALLFALEADSEGEVCLRLKQAFFCRFRHCPVCQARRSRRYYAKFSQSLPKFISDYPSARWVFLTLTVPNVQIDHLREELSKMNQAWHRFIKRKEFKHVLAWVRTTEITKESNREGYAHPHFHILMMVKSTYFSGKNYVNREQWREAWRGAMRDDSIIAVDVRIADRSKEKKLVGVELLKSISETLKYSVKPDDMLLDREWIVELIHQVHKLRFLASGGLFKRLFSEKLTNEEMIHTGEEEKSDEEIGEWRYWWKPFLKKYARKNHSEN